MPISHHPAAQSTFGTVEPGKSFFLDDVFSSDDTEKPISGGIFIYEKSEEDFECAYSDTYFKINEYVLTQFLCRYVRIR